MIEILFRKSSSAMVFVSIASISITPSNLANLNNADMRDDLPAPVLPTIPTFRKKKIYIYSFLKCIK